jgi:hypothetical protein
MATSPSIRVKGADSWHRKQDFLGTRQPQLSMESSGLRSSWTIRSTRGSTRVLGASTGARTSTVWHRLARRRWASSKRRGRSGGRIRVERWQEKEGEDWYRGELVNDGIVKRGVTVEATTHLGRKSAADRRDTPRRSSVQRARAPGARRLVWLVNDTACGVDRAQLANMLILTNQAPFRGRP